MMADLDLDPETQRMVDIAVAGAPALTSDQITELRRVFKPEQWRTAPVTRTPATRPLRQAA